MYNYYDEPIGRRNAHARDNYNKKKKQRKYKRWQTNNESDFRCAHCKEMVVLNPQMGTAHRNHCNHCLHSLHVDTKPGNRASTCRTKMEPIGLCFKHNGYDKYGHERSGDLMIIHACMGCGEININRIAADDSCDKLLKVFESSLLLDQSIKNKIEEKGINLLNEKDRTSINTALFGKTYP